jgi:hypothetical protein
MQAQVFGKSFWDDKKTRYQVQRDLARKGRELASLVGGSESDPTVMQLLFVEKMVCEKSKFIRQVRATRT